MHPQRLPFFSRPGGARWLNCVFLLLGLAAGALQAAPVIAPVSGEIQSITLNDPNDHWSGGTLTVGGQNVIIPRNLLLDLPANRLTLQQLYAEAPDGCKAVGQTGLAKADSCNTTGMGGVATIAANRTNAGNVIAGDVFIEKGIEAVTGIVSYIDYTDGYFRLNGTPGDPATGVMVRLNDPGARHTVQQGLGCAGGPNCSPDPRFTLDPDNYTNVFTTGFPLCIPSTVARPFDGATIGLAADAIAIAQPDGSGDLLCPLSNRTVNGGVPVDDSRRMAPIMIGDSITAEGNFERINGTRFLSAHSTMVARALTTKNEAGQPDYLFLDEVEIDVGGFQNQRIRTLIIGFSTLAPSDVVIWSVHYDPMNNQPHEFPLASVLGCDIAAGPGTCGQQGLVGAGANIFKIRHDVDFLTGAAAKLNPCAHLRADPRLAGLNLCPNGGSAQFNLAEMMGILSPVPREIQARTGHAMANPGLVTLDINGNAATNGQYLFPFGMGLGGIATPEFVEIDLNATQTAISFSGIPWNLDRRLSPGGCDGACEATPQPLDPFPFEGFDPRSQANLPTGSYSDGNYTATTLSSVRDRILSFVDPSLSRSAGDGAVTPAAGNFNGNATRLAWPPADPPLFPISPTNEPVLMCTVDTSVPTTPVPDPGAGGGTATPPANTAPVANPDSAATDAGVPVDVAVLANDSDADGDPLSVVAVTQGNNGTVANNGLTVSYTPNAGFSGSDEFSYTVADGRGGIAVGVVTITVRSQEALAVTVAEFRTGKNEWRVSGTSSRIGATVTVHVGSTLAGTALGSAAVGVTGAWIVRLRNSGMVPDASRTVSVESTGGASRLAVPLNVRN